MSLAKNSLENILSLCYSRISRAKYNKPSSEVDHLINPLSSRWQCFFSSMTFSRWVRRSWSSSCNFSLSTGAADLLILPPDSNTCFSSDFYKQRIKDIYKEIKSKKKRFYTCDNNNENDKISLNERDSFKIGLISKVQQVLPVSLQSLEFLNQTHPFEAEISYCWAV